MSSPISHAELINAVQTLRFPTLFNATLNPASPHPDLPASETGVLEKITDDGRRFVFATSGFACSGHGFILYEDVCHVSWPHEPLDKEQSHKNYLMIAFHHRPEITMYIDNKEGSISFGGLIKSMQSLTRRPAEPPSVNAANSAIPNPARPR